MVEKHTVDAIFLNDLSLSLFKSKLIFSFLNEQNNEAKEFI
jgi:hypothetical protein